MRRQFEERALLVPEVEDEKIPEVIGVFVQKEKIKDSSEKVDIENDAEELNDIEATKAEDPTNEIPTAAKDGVPAAATESDAPRDGAPAEETVGMMAASDNQEAHWLRLEELLRSLDASTDMGKIFKHLTETSSHKVTGYELTWLVRKEDEEEAPAEIDAVHNRPTLLRTHGRSSPPPDATAAEVSTETEIIWLFDKDEGTNTPAEVDAAPHGRGPSEDRRGRECS